MSLISASMIRISDLQFQNSKFLLPRSLVESWGEDLTSSLLWTRVVLGEHNGESETTSPWASHPLSPALLPNGEGRKTSFVSQCHQRIDLRRPARGDVTRDQS